LRKNFQQKSLGAYYTRPEITTYLSKRTIHSCILQKIKPQVIAESLALGRANAEETEALSAAKGKNPPFSSMEELLANLEADLCRKLLAILPTISILDPACGDGAFLVAALETLTGIYEAIMSRIASLRDPDLMHWLEQARAEHGNLAYFIKKKIIRENLFGVDIMQEAVETTRQRLYEALVYHCKGGSSVDEGMEPLRSPAMGSELHFNIRTGNALIGLLQSDKDAWDADAACLNRLLLAEFKGLGITYQQATWNAQEQRAGKPIARALTIADIEALQPFHWSYEFPQIMRERGGFDIIITNPPWEIYKPQAKEFLATHSELVRKNSMRIEDFALEQARLLQDPEIRAAWLDYASRFAYQSAYFRSAAQYRCQLSIINGKKHGSDINLYKLFTEQCYNLLREGGFCGLVIPSGIYTDLGAKKLREMLFEQARITGMCCFENTKTIFAQVHRSYKFVVLTFEKGGQTQAFPAAFMRQDIAELQSFPENGAVEIPVALIRRLAPGSLSIMEFKHDMDRRIARKMLEYPLLGERLAKTWNLVLANELHMTNDSSLFRTEPAPGSLPLYEGKMIHQFATYRSLTSLARPRYWVLEQEGRRALPGHKSDSGQQLDYQYYRLAYRSIGRKTDRRALIATILPRNVFAGNSLFVSRRLDPGNRQPTEADQSAVGAMNRPLRERFEGDDVAGSLLIDDCELLYLVAILNSFVADYFTGQKISANLNMFYIYQLPVPRLPREDARFRMIVERAARLICITPEYDALWEIVMPCSTWSSALVAIEAKERATLRAEMDGLIAHLYGLSEEEFCHVLETFPLVEKSVKARVLYAYCKYDALPQLLRGYQ